MIKAFNYIFKRVLILISHINRIDIRTLRSNFLLFKPYTYTFMLISIM